jgi:GNAT superfamily N-acetyltransferase
MTDITVRRASEHDLEFAGQDGYVPQETVQRKIEHGEVFLAERDGERVGYLRLGYLWGLLPYIELVRVLEGHRRRGVGRALLVHVEAEMLARGHTMLYSSSQADEPEPQAWHRKMGFVECGFLAGINAGNVGEIFFRKRLDRTDSAS